MPISIKILIPTLIFLFLASLSDAYGQRFTIDTTSFLDPQLLLEGPEYFDYKFDINSIAGEAVTGGMMFVPVSVNYKNRWDTLNIKIGRTDWSKVSDTTVLFKNSVAENAFAFPFKGKVISKYGPRGGRIHAGIDIKLKKGDTIVSAFDGKVRIARTISGYGKLIVVRHNNGLETVYGHLSSYLVKVNDEVVAGQPIGLGGRTGRATTEHLHFETRILGEHFNPEKIIDFENGVMKQDLLVMDKTLLGFGSRKASREAAPINETNAKYHKIKSGDTLYAIARKNNMTVNELCQLNGISPRKVLKIGSQIRVN